MKIILRFFNTLIDIHRFPFYTQINSKKLLYKLKKYIYPFVNYRYSSHNCQYYIEVVFMPFDIQNLTSGS